MLQRIQIRIAQSHQHRLAASLVEPELPIARRAVAFVAALDGFFLVDRCVDAGEHEDGADGNQYAARHHSALLCFSKRAPHNRTTPSTSMVMDLSRRLAPIA